VGTVAHAEKIRQANKRLNILIITFILDPPFELDRCPKPITKASLLSRRILAQYKSQLNDVILYATIAAEIILSGDSVKN
jgi:hypothetical protein